MFGLVTVGMTMLLASFKSSFMTPYLYKRGYEEDTHGWIIGIPSMFYVISCNIVGRIVDKAPRRIFLIVSLFGMTASGFLLGPSQILGMPDSVPLLLCATCFNAIAQGFIFIPVLPEVIDSVYQGRGIVEGEDDLLEAVLNDKAAALYGLFYAIGAIIAPLLGSFVYNQTKGNWRLTCDCFAILAGVFSVLFLVGNVLPDIHKEKAIRQAMLEK